MAEPRVLLVEDEPSYARFLIETLRESGVPVSNVRAVGSLAEALEALDAGVYDVALADLGLPDADGTEVVSRLVARLPTLPLVVLSGVNDLEVALDSMRLGAQEYLVKGQAELPLLLRAIRYAIERKRLQDVAIVARAEAEKANAMKDAFIAMLGHELRNPLAPISAGLSLIARHGVPGVARELTIVRRQVQVLSSLVDDLLDVSRIAHGKMELHREAVEIADVVELGLEAARPQIAERGHSLAVEVPRTLIVNADKIRLAQVFSNLFTNAAKYTPPRGNIWVTVVARDGHVEVRVRDSGIGMTEELRASAFELFHQGSRTVDRAAGGLGLGLAIARSIVKLHDGSISAASDGPGMGSELAVRLPLHAARSAHVPPAVVHPAATSSPRRVLVVDDNRDAAEMLGMALETMGHVARIVHDGAQALRANAEFRADVALIDIGLPGMNGYEVARQIRAQCGAQVPLLVAVTGFGQPSDRATAYEAGFDRFLVKPVELDQIEQLVGAAPSVDRR